MSLGNLELIEEKFLEAAADPSQWVNALDVVTSVTESFGAVLLPISGGMISALPFTDSLNGSFESFIKDGWYTRDERNRGVGIMKKMGVVDDLDLFTVDDIMRHPYYQEFLAPHGLRWFCGIGISCGNDLWCLSIQRSIEQGPFSAEEKKKLAHLSKRLSGTAAIANTIAGTTVTGALEAFEMSGRGAALINRSGEIFRLNNVAEQILKRDVRVIKGKLVARDAVASAAFYRAVNELLNNPTAATRHPIAFTRVGRHPLLAYPAKLSSMARNGLADCQVIAVFVDTELGLRPPISALQMVFHLTDAEARLAARLATGEPLERAADHIGVSKETSRTHLKGIFAKTGCHRQAELVAVLSTFLKVGIESIHLPQSGEDQSSLKAKINLLSSIEIAKAHVGRLPWAVHPVFSLIHRPSLWHQHFARQFATLSKSQSQSSTFPNRSFRGQ